MLDATSSTDKSVAPLVVDSEVPMLTSNAKRVLESRYLNRQNGLIVETPHQMFERVARHVASAEPTNHQRDHWTSVFLKIMVDGRMIPNSPTLMNAGRNDNLLSACYVLPVPDSTNKIFNSVSATALIQKAGGGCVSGDSYIFVKNIGPVKLRDMCAALPRPDVDGVFTEINDVEVLTVDNDGKHCFRKASRIWRFVDKDTRNIETMYGTLTTSKEHPCMAVSVNGTEFIAAESVDVGTALFSHKVDTASLSLDKRAYLAGLIVGDGLCSDNAPADRLRIFSGDHETLRVASQYVKDVYGRSYAVSSSNSRGTLWEMTVYDKVAISDAKAWIGVGAKTNIAGFMPTSLDEAASYIAGLIDSDGYIDAERARASISSVHADLCCNIRTILGVLGCPTTLRAREPGKKGKQVCYEVTFAVHDAPWLLPLVNRKLRKERIEAWLATPDNRTVHLPDWVREKILASGLFQAASGPNRGMLGNSGQDVQTIVYKQVTKTAKRILRTVADELEDNSVALLADAISVRTRTSGVESDLYDLTVDEFNRYVVVCDGLPTVVHNTGFAFDELRPCGSYVSSSGGKSSGPLSFWRVFSEATSAIQQGSFRRGANMAMFSVSHPDIVKFLWAKQDLQQFENYNISVKVPDDWMAAPDDQPHIVSWTYRRKEQRWYIPRSIVERCKQAVAAGISKERHPRELDTCYGVDDLLPVDTSAPDDCLTVGEIKQLIIKNAWQTGEPGLCFIDRIRETEALPKIAPINATNPCVAGDTLVATADGRGCVPIKQLAEEGQDVPVWCCDPQTGEAHVRMGRNPRLTREAARVITLQLSGGSDVVVTPDHKMILRNGQSRLAKDLKPGDSLMPFIRWSEVNTTTGKKYWSVSCKRLHNGQRSWKAEHREIARISNLDFVEDCVVHHINEDSLDNRPSNLACMSIAAHNQLHPQISKRAGTDNPMYGKQHSVATKAKIGVKTAERFTTAEFRDKHSVAVRAAMTEDVKDKLRGRRVDYVTVKCRACSRSEELPPSDAVDYQFCSLACANKRLESDEQLIDFGIDCVATCGRLSDRVYQTKYKKLRNNAPDVKVYVRRFGSFKRFKELVYARYNHSVVAVLDSGATCDVYNMTVDEFHNYACVNMSGKTRVHGNLKHKGIVVGNCGEQPLSAWESCNLASINLAFYVKPFWECAAELPLDERIDWAALRDDVYITTRFLDDVVDANNHPVQELTDANQSNRRIGLGIMGFADALVKLDIQYDSPSGFEMGERFMKFVNEAALSASEQLAEERGAFPNYEHSRWVERGRKLRNACVTTVAPTGTISIIADCSGGMEPLFSFVFFRHVLNGQKMTEVNRHFKAIATEFGFDDPAVYEHVATTGTVEGCDRIPQRFKRIFRSARDIAPVDHIKMQAAFQKHVTSAISKTINLPEWATEADVAAAYQTAFEMKCKGVTVYRDNCRNGQPMALKAKPATAVEPSATPAAVSTAPLVLNPLPAFISTIYYKHKCTYGNLHMHIGYLPLENGTWRECQVFFEIGRSGDSHNAILDSTARLCSMLLRAGVDFLSVVDQLSGGKSFREQYSSGGVATSLPNEIAGGLLEFYQKTLPCRDETGYLTCPPGDVCGSAGVVDAAAPITDGAAVRQAIKRATGNVVRLRSMVTRADILSYPCPTRGCNGQLVVSEGCKKCFSCGISQC